MYNYVYHGDNLDLLDRMIQKGTEVDLIYLDPPFNTGKTQEIHGRSYDDRFSLLEYQRFLTPRLVSCWELLKDTGSLYLHLDYRMVHYARTWLDQVFGDSRCLINEIIWAYDYGGRPKNRWPAKHDNILFYAKNPDKYYFSFAEVDRIPYMAPNLVGAEKAERGKLPTDVFWHTIVHTTGSERWDYPTQKPKGIIKRLVVASCPRGGIVLDPFAGSGTTGEVCLESGRQFILCDNNLQAIEVMSERLGNAIQVLQL